MTAFIAAAATLTLLTLALLLRPAYARGPGRVLASRATIAGVVLAVPLAAAGLYALLGDRSALDPQHAQGAIDPQVEKLVAGLAARLERDPSDKKGWVMLARSYKVMGRWPEAQQAYERAGDAIASDAQELANYADTVASNQNGRLAGKPMQLIEQALRVDPQNTMALWLAGAAALEGGDTAGGVAIWRKLLALLPPESDDARELRSQIVQVGGKVDDVAAAPPAAGASISGRVELAPGLDAAPQDVVFVIAKAPGQRMPAAVVRTTVGQLPFDFKLDDSLAMTPELRLSKLRDVQVEARISRDGQPIAQPSDLVADAQPVQVGASGVVLRISHERTRAK